jgi:DNA-binding HxlR family transcriptional regulator
MTRIKESSTIQENKQIAHSICPVTYIMNRIGGHWKPIILYNLLSGAKRYSEIKKAMPAITEKMLIQHLKQLENDNLVIREAKPVVPPYVTYRLTTSGEALRQVLVEMSKWSIAESRREGSDLYKDLGEMPF